MDKEIKELAEKIFLVRLGGYTGPNNNFQLPGDNPAKEWYRDSVRVAKVIVEEQQTYL